MTRSRTGEVVPGLGARLRELRTAAGLTQEALSAGAGTKIETISRIETGANTPDLDTLSRLAAALNLPIQTLFPVGVHDEEVRDPQSAILLERCRALAAEDRRLLLVILERLVRS